MQKLLLLLLPLAIAACVERDAVPANSAGTPRVETYPSAPSSASSSTASPSTPSTGVPAQRTTLPGRGEGERESAPADVGDDMPDGSLDVSETSDEERNRAGSSDAAPSERSGRSGRSGRGVEHDPLIDPTNDPAIIDESGSTGFGGTVLSPESLGDGEVRPDDAEPLMPADVVDAGPALIP